MAFDAFGAAGWYESGHGWVAVIRAPAGYDPSPLVGQLVTINGIGRVVRGLEANLPVDTAPTDASGTTFGLLV